MDHIEELILRETSWRTDAEGSRPASFPHALHVYRRRGRVGFWIEHNYEGDATVEVSPEALDTLLAFVHDTRVLPAEEA